MAQWQLLLLSWQRRLNRRAYLLHLSAVILPCWLECRNDSVQLMNICASSPHPPKSGRLLHTDSSIFSDSNILIAFFYFWCLLTQMQCLLSCRVQGEMKSFSKFWKEIAEIGAWVCGEFFFKTTFFPCSLQKKNLPLPLSIPLVQPACLHGLSSKIKGPKGLSCDFAWIIAMTRLLNTGIMFLCPVSSGEDAALALSFAFYLLQNTLS